MNNKQIIGYTTGVFDLFHIGHLNILKNAKSLCDYLIVGVTTDEVTYSMKGKNPIIPFKERFEIVESIKYVDKAVAKNSINNLDAAQELHFNLFIKGDDWKNTAKGIDLETNMAKFNIEVKYFPYTQNTSSSLLRDVLEKI